MARQRPRGQGDPQASDGEPSKLVSGKRKPRREETLPTATWSLLALVLILLLGFGFYNQKSGGDRRPMPIRPLDAPKVTDLHQFAGQYEEELYWGTYRPSLYLGLRAREPKSVVAGLMWFGAKEEQFSLRHICEQGDGLQEYGWVRHDGFSFGRQEILDGGYFLETTFLKKSRSEGSTGYGGDWAVRISGQANPAGLMKNSGLPAALFSQLSMFFYVMDENQEPLDILPEPEEEESAQGPLKVVAAGSMKQVGPWRLYVRDTEHKAQESFTGVYAEHAHNLSQVVMAHLQSQMQVKQKVELSGEVQEGANVGVFQLTMNLPFSVDIAFVTGDDEVESREHALTLTGRELDKKIKGKEAAFDRQFDRTFQLQKKGLSQGDVEVAKAAISNMLGGMGYFYGQSRIAIPPHQAKATKEPYWNYWEAPLYTATPSRSFFPRGFLWDEGFHQLLISRWDERLSLDVMAHWLDLMNAEGWIPREQILGEEARSKVPEEFILQHTTNANPPTLFLPLKRLVEGVAKGGASIAASKAFLERSYPRLKAWFRWFNTTQVGQGPGSYYWHGRDPSAQRELNPKTLSSGLDDYPRASHPDSTERHLDLRCWMALAALAMAEIAKVLGHDNKDYAETAAFLTDPSLLYKLHLDNKSGNFYDYGLHTEKVELDWVQQTDPKTGAAISRELLRRVERAPEPSLVPHYGYVSLFPLLMKILPHDSDILAQQLNKLKDEKLLWTSYGLRSLATTSSLYMKRNTEHDAPYWRGPVWVNLNYLTLAALHHYHQGNGPHSKLAGEIYGDLRSNLIRNIVQRYRESGYLWEQYDNVADGVGKGSHPFTGWTALLVLIMAEMY